MAGRPQPTPHMANMCVGTSRQGRFGRDGDPLRPGRCHPFTTARTGSAVIRRPGWHAVTVIDGESDSSSSSGNGFRLAEQSSSTGVVAHHHVPAVGQGTPEAQAMSENSGNDEQTHHSPGDKRPKQHTTLDSFDSSAWYPVCLTFGGGHFDLHCEHISQLPRLGRASQTE